MEWVKGTIGMNCFWLISSCSSFFCFRLSFRFCIYFIFISFVSFSLCLSHCLFVFFSIHEILCIFFIYIFLVFLYFVFCSHDAVILFSWCCLLFSVYFSVFSIFFKLLKVILACAAAIFHSSPTSNTSVETVLIIFNMSTFFLFELLSVWHGYSAIRISLQFSRPNSSNDFIELIRCLWESVLFIDKIYYLFYVLPFFLT